MREFASYPARTGKRGVALPAVMALLALMIILFYLALDRTIGERNHVLAFYYENVALDLAESGVSYALAELEQGNPISTRTMRLDTFRGLEGSFEVQVEPLSDQRHAIVSIGRLTDSSGQVQYSTRVRVSGRWVASGPSRTFRVEDYRELTNE